MHPFASYVLRSYYRETGWNEDNLYANLTRSSNALLDFSVPRGLHFSISKSPNSLFKTTYSMNALPSLNGSVGYIFTSCNLDVKGSGDVRFKDMVDRFKVFDQPRKPEGKEEEWLAGERVDTRDYLLYGRIYVPTGRLDALYSTRITPTLQGMVAAISDPRAPISYEKSKGHGPASNIMFSLQQDTGKWCTEYTWSAEDGMWGVRSLYNFGKVGPAPESDSDKAGHTSAGRRSGVKRVDEEEAMEGGLRGRVSVGGEFYFSAKEKSAGVSTGIRFTTVPDATPPSFQVPSSSSSPSSPTPRGPPSQPPTTITALFNPMLGHISGAYAARVSRDLSLASRFDFNVYSYESEWSVGAEWWQRRGKHHPPLPTEDEPPSALGSVSVSELADEVQGVVKAKVSTTTDVSLLWEGRLRNVLVSLGVVSNLSSRSKPIKSVGLELSYFSSG
ncbi:mitochondrial distribution and morphology protein 10 [Trametes versicolor FP-101664 SS1]|uniref:mitochondrial distribution and morphology protein 10 n=1 Tax=Trametes versicolor (strain FP-101664) TaxID=717944 RepID=UPI0004621E6E|nr:mitochondrial distribution and morphology protein 10 [Trametes versicolor FP-101664 SS1]EIW61284.1 mitochondrial distribution and morphology protein 10 [Trametes versicolor FP-101664 SS1]